MRRHRGAARRSGFAGSGVSGRADRSGVARGGRHARYIGPAAEETEGTRVDGSDGGPVLGLESSCDETAAAVVRAADGAILAEAVLGQEKEHAPFGGVVPEIAARAHLEHLPRLAAARAARSRPRCRGNCRASQPPPGRG